MKRISRLGFCFGLTAFLIGCAVQAPSTASTAEVIRYQKTMCFGPCPAFIFEVNAFGGCTLEVTRPFRDGKLAGLEPGLYKSELGQIEDWNFAISQAYEHTEYRDLAPAYDDPRITDLPSTITTIRGYEVVNRYKGPDLATLYAVLDTTMANLAWRPIQTKNQ